MRLRRPRLPLGLVLAALIAVGTALVAQATGVLGSVEQATVSARFELRGAATPDDLLVVGIDDKTFADLKLQWPFRRRVHARAVDALHRLGARQIVYDVQFTEPTNPRDDGALFDAVGRAGGAILATSESDDAGRTSVLGGDDNLAAVGARAGAANLPSGPGTVLDHFPYANGRLRSLAAVTADRLGRPVSRSAFGSNGAWIDFRGPPGTVDSVSFSSLINGEVDPRRVRGRIVVVGATAPSLQDVHGTPTDSEPMSGAEVQANAIWTALHGLGLRDASLLLNLALVIGLALALPLLSLRLRVLTTALSGPALALAYLEASQIAFQHGVVTWVTAPLVAVAVSTLTTIVVSHLAESAARRHFADDNDLLEAKVRERTTELREVQLEILHRLSHAAEWRDRDTGLHVARMGKLSQRLALAAGLSEADAEELGNAAVAHDIGKIAIPDRILQKPGPLTLDEQHEMEQHATIGATMLGDSRSPVMQLAETIARTHHERWDGQGYPNGLAGTEIPVAGRICGICDVFDALVSERPYKDPWSLDEALAEINRQRGGHFDPELALLFVELAPAAHADLYAPKVLADAHALAPRPLLAR